MCNAEGAPGLTTLLRRCRGSCCTRRPVVTISSLADDSEDDEGCELISTHESGAKKSEYASKCCEHHSKSITASVCIVLISDFGKQRQACRTCVCLGTHLPISLDFQTKLIERPCRAADQVAVGWSKLCVGWWYAPWSRFLINSEAQSTYSSVPHAKQVYQLLLLLSSVRNDGYGSIESSATEAMSASPLPAQEGRSVGRRRPLSSGRLAQVVYGWARQGRRGTEAHVASTDWITITFAIAVRRALTSR